MSNEELLKPRYRVIADYPESECFVGSVIEKCGDRYIDDKGFMIMATNKPEMYPAIFKELMWWEDREPNDLPKYVRVTSSIPFYRFEKNQIVSLDSIDFNKKENKWSATLFGKPLIKMDNLLPATKEEYEKFITHPIQG